MKVITQEDDFYPHEVCSKCGKEATEWCGKEFPAIPTYHLGTCEVCGRVYESVAEPRDFGYPDFQVSDQRYEEIKQQYNGGKKIMESHAPLQDLNIDNEVKEDLEGLQLQKAIVFCDIDGILADCNHRLPYLEKKEYDKFYGSNMADDATTGLTAVALYAFLCGISHLYKSTRFILVTGRPARTRSLTRLWLRDTYPHLFADIIDLQDRHILCRDNDDWRPANQVKVEKISKYIQAETTCAVDPGDVAASEFVRGQFDMFFIDDDPKTIATITSLFDNAMGQLGILTDVLTDSFHPILLDSKRLAKNYVPSKSSEE